MGPRPFSRGNIGLANCPPTAGSRLQWGRGLSAAEIDLPAVRSIIGDIGFNGAAAFQPRK